MKILAVIPARKGSKGVVGKNKKILGSIPLIEWTIQFAKSLDNIEILVSTNDSEILKLSRSYDVIDNGLRPESLSTDNALTIDVLKHELELFKQSGKHADGILLLQPTCPYRLKKIFDEAISSFISLEGEYSFIGVKDVEGNHPCRMKLIKDDMLINYEDKETEDMRPRQELPKVYLRNGSLYLTSTENIENGNVVGSLQKPVIMDNLLSVNIDSNIDFIIAENFKDEFLEIKDY